MNKNLIIGIVAVLAVAGVGAYVAMNPGLISNYGGTAAVIENSQENESTSAGSTFAELIARGQSVQCTFTYDDGQGNVSAGTVYMAAGGAKIRGDFTVTSPVATEAHLVRAGGYNYLWGPQMPQGIKTKVTNENELTAGESSGFDPNTKFSCKSWTMDDSAFSLPATIKFIDLDAMKP